MTVLRESELKYLARGVFGVLGAAGMVAALWSSAWSPGALAGPGRMLLEGDAEGAKEAYVSLAEGLGSDETRAEALWRGALLTATDLKEPLTAIQMLTDLVDRHPGSTRAIEAHAEMARLYRDQLDEPARAAPLWAQAAELAPEHPSAGTWLLEAGKTYEAAGLMGEAIATLEQATQYESVVASAHMALGPILLDADPAAATLHYEEAIETATDDAMQRLARLGLATALEHEKKYAEALAQLELVEPDDAVKHRQDRLAGLMDDGRTVAATP